jgi:hypothetical protein
MKAGTTQPIFMEAIEILLVDENETTDLAMCAIHNGASKEKIKAEFPYRGQKRSI